MESTTTVSDAAVAAAPTSIIEHVVLLNISDETHTNPDDPTTPINSAYLIASLNSLTALPVVLHLTAGPILRLHVTPSLSLPPSPLTFTHLIHARYESISHLAQYSSHPAHESLVSLARPIRLDILALDWAVPSLSGPISPLPGRAMRITLYKLKGEDEGEKREVMEELGRIGGMLGASEQFTFGENVSFGREKGFAMGSLVVFRDLNELDASEEHEDLVRRMTERFKGVIERFLAVDYVVPRSHI
ncbi:hypothetical protein Droror1_Dr00007134 [Drosera rotundifolia]